MVHETENESAVSPVIGTILLVAITVVLVVIIAAVVMGLSGSMQTTKDVGLIVKSDMVAANREGLELSLLKVTIFGGTDVKNLRFINVSVEGAEGVRFRGHAGLDMRNSSAISAFLREPIISSDDLIGLPLYYIMYPLPGNPDDHPEGYGPFKEYQNALITVTGTFSDGTQSVLYIGEITCYNTPDNVRAQIGWEDRVQSPFIM